MLLLLSSTHAISGPLDFANGLYRQRRYALAADEYAAYLQNQPSGADALAAKFYLAECHVQLKRDDLARPLFDAIVKETQSGPSAQSEQRPVALFRSGELAFNAAQFPEAAERLSQYRKEFSDHELFAHATYMLAEATLAGGDVPLAEKLLSEVDLAKAPLTLQPYLRFTNAKIARRAGRAEEAARSLAEIAKDDKSPLADDALLELGMLQYERQDHAAAIAAFDDLIARFSGSLTGPARLYRAISLERVSRSGEAQTALETLYRDPQAEVSMRAEAAYRLSLMLNAAKDHKGAIELLAAARREFANQAIASTLQFQEALSRYKDPAEYATARQHFEGFLRDHPQHALAPQANYYLLRIGLESGDRALVDQVWSQFKSDTSKSVWSDQARLVLAEAILADKLSTSAAADQPPPSKSESILDLATASVDPKTAARLRVYAANALFRESRFEQVVSTLKPVDENVADPQVVRDAQYLAGIAHARLDRPAEAADALKRYLQVADASPQTTTAFATWAVALSRLPASMNVEAQFSDLWDRAAKSAKPVELLLAIANQLYSQRLYAQSLVAYQKVLASSSTPAEKSAASLGAGWCHYELGEKSAASGRFREAADLAPADSDQLAESLLMAGVAIEADDPAAAIGHYKRVVEQLSSSRSFGEAADRLAGLYAKEGQAAEADKLYEALASSSNPAIKAKATLDRAWLALERKDATAAQKLFESAASMPEGSVAVEASLKLAELAYNGGDYSRSLEWVAHAESKTPPETVLPSLLYRKALALRQMKRTDEARQVFSSLVASHPDSVLAAASLFWSGEIDFDTRRFDEAIATFQSLATSEKPGKYLGLAQLRIAQAYFEKQSYAEAEKQADQVARLDDPELRDEAVYLQARIRQQNAQFDEARELYRSIIADKKTETAAKAQFMVGETFLFQEQYDQAIKELLKVHILFPHPTWQSYALLEVGKCYEKKGDNAAARETYQSLLAEFPQESAAVQAKTRIENLDSPQGKGS